MKFSTLLNLPLRWAGVKLVRLSSLEKLQSTRPEAFIKDILRDKAFMALYEKAEPFTMAGVERGYALYQSLCFIHAHAIPGDIVECGVWRGGSCLLAALYLRSVGDTSRRIWLYDTFEGMTQPGSNDGAFERAEWERLKTGNEASDWCRSPLDQVKATMQSSGYPSDKIVYVKGKVEETIPGEMPPQIALLRLDTDWYASTRHELEHLFPLLSDNGALLVDDYGQWSGAQKATDEYFAGRPYFLHRIDSSGRLVIKR